MPSQVTPCQEPLKRSPEFQRGDNRELGKSFLEEVTSEMNLKDYIGVPDKRKGQRKAQRNSMHR